MYIACDWYLAAVYFAQQSSGVLAGNLVLLSKVFLCLSTKSSSAQKNFANQSKVTSQNTMLHVQFVTGILLIFAKQETVKQ